MNSERANIVKSLDDAVDKLGQLHPCAVFRYEDIGSIDSAIRNARSFLAKEALADKSDKTVEDLRKSALAKLSREEREALGHPSVRQINVGTEDRQIWIDDPADRGHALLEMVAGLQAKGVDIRREIGTRPDTAGMP